jgi:hypothetical protein
MTNFEDQLFNDLMAGHGAQLRQPGSSQPGSEAAAGTSPARRRLPAVRRPVWLVTGAAGVAAAATAAVVTLGGAAPAFAVSRGADGTVQVSVSELSGVAGANAALHRMGIPVRVVPVRPGCRPMSSLPHPHLTEHPWVSVGSGIGPGGHRKVTVKMSHTGGVPAGSTMLLAFSTQGGTSLGAGGLITGPVPKCVSLAGQHGSYSSSAAG